MYMYFDLPVGFCSVGCVVGWHQVTKPVGVYDDLSEAAL
jgi:hypothetical protein